MRRRRRAITDGAGKMEGVESGSVPRGRSLGGHYSYCFIIGNFFLSGLCWVRGATVELPPAIKDPEWSRAFRLNATWNRRAAWFAGFGVIFASLASVVAVASVLGYR